MDFAEKYDVLYEEWNKYIRGAPVSEFIISSTILDSWDRCREKNVNPYLTRVPVVLDDDELAEILKKNEELIDISLPFMKNLYSLVVGSGFLVALFDADGYMLKLVGDNDVMERVKRGNFIVGSCWSEEVAGTNGAGTVIKLEKPFQVYAGEHYCINSHKWTCSGAPVHDLSGKLIGVIDMTGPYQKANPHTLGMVAAAAHAIENEIRLRKALTEYRIAHSFQKTVISSIPEIIMTVDNDGCISMMNKNARKAFGEDADRFLGRNTAEVWSKYNKNLLNLINNSDPPPAGAGGFLLYYLDIGIKFWNVRKCFSRIFLYTFYEDFSPISRYPDVMIFCFIDSMGTLATSYTLSYQILTRLDSHYITRQESGVLCGSITLSPIWR
jgi:transcriptional regulator of acetoin/glycerol metabolism